MWQATRSSVVAHRERRWHVGAQRLGIRTAGTEAAAGRRIDRVGRVAAERRLFRSAARVHRRHRREQRFCIGVSRLAIDAADRSQLHDLPKIHHHDPVADEAHHVQIVRDEDVGQVEALLQIDEQVQHLRLDRFVESRHRFVEDDEARFQREGARNIDALALSARQLVRVAVGEQQRVEPDRFKQVHRPRQRRGLGQAMDQRAKRDRHRNRQPRVQRGIRILEHHLHLPMQIAARQVLAGTDRLAVECDRAAVELRRGASAAAPSSTCRNRIRRRCRAFLRRRPRTKRRRPLCTTACVRFSSPPRSGKCLVSPSTASSGVTAARPWPGAARR